MELPHFCSSKDVTSFDTNVAGVIQRGSIHHGLAVCHASPDACCNVLAVLYGVLLHLLDVTLLGRAGSGSDALIVARM